MKKETKEAFRAYVKSIESALDKYSDEKFWSRPKWLQNIMDNGEKLLKAIESENEPQPPTPPPAATA